MDILEARFDLVPESIVRGVRGIEELGVLEALRKSSVTVGTVDEFKETKWIRPSPLTITARCSCPRK